MGIEFKKFSHLGFIKPVPKKEHRSQVSSDFDAFVVAYEKSGKRYRNVRGHEMTSVVHLLRSMPPSHCWKGSMVIKEMQKRGMGEQKVKAVLSCLNQCGWIRYHKVVKDKQFVSSVMEVMFLRLPQEEAGIDRLIRLDDEGRPSIFRRDGEDWVAVSEEEYPSGYTTDSLPERAQLQVDEDADPQVWLPSEWRSSEQAPDEQEPSPVYEEDVISEDSIQIHPTSPLSAKGDESVDSREERQRYGEAVSFSGESESARDSTSSPPGRTPNLDRLIQRLVELGMRSIDDPASRISYESFVMEQLLPELVAEKCGFLTKWHAQEGRDWLVNSPAARVFLALFKDTLWPDDMGRFFHRKAKNLTWDHWRKLLMGFDWRLKEKRSLDSLVENKNGKPSFKGWDPFWDAINQGYERRRQDSACFLQFLSLPEGQTDRSEAEFWIQQNKLVGTDLPPVGTDCAG